MIAGWNMNNNKLKSQREIRSITGREQGDWWSRGQRTEKCRRSAKFEAGAVLVGCNQMGH